jgi:hypothetical protein
MFKQARSGHYFCDIDEHGPALAKRCFGIMREELRFNICDLPSSFIPDDKIDGLQERIKEKISAPLAYACGYWAMHLSAVTKSGEVMEEVGEFFQDRLLFWMEVMSVRQRLVVGIHGLLSVKQWVTVSGGMFCISQAYI